MTSTRGQLANDARRRRTVFGGYGLLVLCCGAIAWSTAPAPFSLAFVVLVLGCGAAFLRPTIGVYAVVVLTLIGDTETMAWWPFTKNLSSRESIFFVSPSLTINPLEVLLAVTTAGWIMRRLADPTWRFYRGRLFWPILVLTGFIFSGIARGQGGDTRVAIFEFRALIYIPWVYLIVSNLLTTRRQYQILLVLSAVAVTIQSIFSLVYYAALSPAERADLESLSQHAATIHMNAIIIMMIAMWALRGRLTVRWLLTVCIVPITWAYLLSQRRAAMVALFMGLFVLFVVLFFRRRRAFWYLAPAAIVLGLGLVAVGWNSTGAIGLPAQAVKTVLFPSQVSEADASSDAYRVGEAYDIYFTIRQNPLLGVGFGQQFYRPVQLPDISFFEFWEYMPHNSLLWLWLKLGFFGFVSAMFVFARAVQLGIRSALVVRTREQAAYIVVGVTYVAMFVMFAYVDIAWDARSTVFLAVALAVCADYETARDAASVNGRRLHAHQLEVLAA